MMRTLYVLPAVASFLVLVACGGEQSADAEAAAETLTAEVPVTTVTLNAKTPGTDYSEATITDWSFEADAFSFEIDAETYTLGNQTPDADQTMCANSGKGQHIHLIVDNEPYAAKYEANFEYPLSDGEHHILAFLSRSYHESIKTDAAHRAVKVMVENGSFTAEENIEEPMLFYSRPKGTYVGKDAEKLLLDFYPVGVTLGQNARVKVDVAGESFVLDEWQPYVLEGLPMGENTVTLTLIDDAGATIPAPHNPVSRTFTLKADPAM